MKRILIAENDISFAESIVDVLEKEGFRALVSANESEAMEIVKDDRIDLVILDAELPGAGGYSMCIRLKNTLSLGNIPVILISSEATAEVFQKHRMFKDRADEYFLKPFKPVDLIPVVKRLLVAGDGGRVVDENGGQEVSEDDIIEEKDIV